MRWFKLAGVLLIVSCGPPVLEQQTLKDGSVQVTCQLSMDECVRKAEQQCKNQRYRILEGTSETRLRDAPPFERAYHTSRLRLKCTNDGADVLLSTSSKPDSVEGKPTTASNVCTQGQTRECIGPGACKGGQACLADGSGFGNCDCGPATAPSGAASTAPEAVTPVLPASGEAPAAPPASSPPATSPVPAR